jgi:hypothetical protein
MKPSGTLPVFHPPAIVYIFPLLDDYRMIQYSCHVVLSLCGQVAEGEAAQISVLVVNVSTGYAVDIFSPGSNPGRTCDERVG